MCRSKKNRSTPSQRADFIGQEKDTTAGAQNSASSDMEVLSLFNIQVVKPTLSKAGIKQDLIVDAKPLQMELDRMEVS